MALVQVQSGGVAVGGGGNPSLSPGRATDTVLSSVVSTSIPLSPGRFGSRFYLPTQSQASYRSASSSPSARRPSSGFDVDNEEADERENVVVADGHADVCASATMTDDHDDDADDGNFDDTLSEILGASFRDTPSLDRDFASGAVDSNVDLAFSPPLPPSPPLCSFFCCCRGALLRSRSFHYHNHLSPLLVDVL